MGGGEAKAAAGLGGAGIAAEDLVSGEFGADPPAIVEGGPGEGIAGEIELAARFDGGDKFGVDGSRVGGIEKPGVDDVALEVDDFGVGGGARLGATCTICPARRTTVASGSSWPGARKTRAPTRATVRGWKPAETGVCARAGLEATGERREPREATSAKPAVSQNERRGERRRSSGERDMMSGASRCGVKVSVDEGSSGAARGARDSGG